MLEILEKKEEDPGKFSIKYVTNQGIQSYHRNFFLNNPENRGLTYCQLTAGTLLVFLVLLVKVFQILPYHRGYDGYS